MKASPILPLASLSVPLPAGFCTRPAMGRLRWDAYLSRKQCLQTELSKRERSVRESILILASSVCAIPECMHRWGLGRIQPSTRPRRASI